jgi:hypothetical protein
VQQIPGDEHTGGHSLMEEMIGYCGYDCHLCAARSDDPAVRQRLVDGWRRIFGHEHYTADNVRCDGCRGDGRLADKECTARPCAMERGVESCALCEEFVCKKVGHLLASREGMLVFLQRKMIDVTEDEYLLCARQFESMPNLIRILARAGKLPSWVAGAGPQKD